MKYFLITCDSCGAEDKVDGGHTSPRLPRGAWLTIAFPAPTATHAGLTADGRPGPERRHTFCSIPCARRWLTGTAGDDAHSIDLGTALVDTDVFYGPVVVNLPSGHEWRITATRVDGHPTTQRTPPPAAPIQPLDVSPGIDAEAETVITIDRDDLNTVLERLTLPNQIHPAATTPA